MTVSDEPENRTDNIPQWQREGWEAYHCAGVGHIDQGYFCHSIHIKRITGKLSSTGIPLNLYTTAPPHDLYKERMGLMVVRCICKRAERYLCEVAEVAEGHVVSFRFTAYSETETRVLGWPVYQLSVGADYDLRAELNELAKWFIHTVNLPLSPFVLLTGERVYNPINYYEGLHILLAKLSASDIVLSSSRIRLFIAKLRSLHESVQANYNDEN